MTPLIAIRALLATLAVLQASVENVGIEDLGSQPGLVGKLVAVDARIDRVDYQKDRGWNQLRLQGSPVLFRLPDRLAFSSPPSQKAARVQGLLREEGGRRVVDVTAVELFRSDLDRLEQGLAALAPQDARTRDAWARWAESRADQYDDPALRSRARELAGDAIRIEADRPDALKSPDRQIELARKARGRHVPAPVPASLIHRALRQRLPTITNPVEADQLVTVARDLLPDEAKSPQRVDLAGWEAAYANDPAAAYRRAGPEARAAMDRQLLAAAIRKSLELQVAKEPNRALALADEAASALPDFPDLARDLRRRGLEATDVSTLRLDEAQARARAYETLGQPGQARDLLRRWLDDQRTSRLSATDAEGRMLLAEQYERLIDDRSTAVALLREAWTIDPGAERIADAFRRRGYRLIDDAWAAPETAATASSAAGEETGAKANRPAATGAVGLDPYKGLTRREVLNLGIKPTRVARTATQGQIREQWIIEGDSIKGNLYINFVQRPGVPNAIAISSYRQNP